MPGTLKTVFNNGGVPVATSADDFYQRQHLADQSQANEAARLQAMLQDNAANRALQLQMGGSFADKSSLSRGMQDAGFRHDAGMANLQGDIGLELGQQAGEFNLKGIEAGNVPRMTALNNEQARWTAERGDQAKQRALAGKYADVEGNMLGLLFPDMAGAATPPAGWRQSPGDAANEALDNDLTKRGFTPAPPAGIPPGAPGHPGFGGGQAPSQDELMRRWAAFKNPGAVFEADRRKQDRLDAQDTADTQAFTAMATSSDPRVRAIGIAGLQKTRAFGSLPAGTVQGLSKPLVSAGEDFLAQPTVVAEIKAIGTQLAAAGNDSNAEALAVALKPRVDRLVARAAESGADPNQVLQAILGELGKVAPASSLYTNPITTTLGAIPGVRNFVPEPSRDAARRGIGL